MKLPIKRVIQRGQRTPRHNVFRFALCHHSVSIVGTENHCVILLDGRPATLAHTAYGEQLGGAGVDLVVPLIPQAGPCLANRTNLVVYKHKRSVINGGPTTVCTDPKKRKDRKLNERYVNLSQTKC